MADLSNFTAPERAFLASIPYRVGIWISNCDDNARSQIDDRDERKALEAIITAFAAKADKIPFAAAIMRTIESNKNAWPQWEGMSDEAKILEDCDKALKLCAAKKIDGKDINHYKQTIWRIGLTVAQAYGEHIDPDNEMHVDRFFKWIGGMGAAKLEKNPENISKAEKVALNKLRGVLKG